MIYSTSGSVQYRSNHQVEKHRAEPQIDKHEKVEQFAFIRVPAGAERQVNKKRQRGEQEDNQVHRLICLGNDARRRDRSHVNQTAHRGTRGYDMRGDVAAEQDGPDRNTIGTGFIHVHRNMRGIEIRHNQ